MGTGKGLPRCVRGAIAGGVVVGGYVLALRPRMLTWGATDAEVEQRLPGDDLVTGAKMEATHAITIGATAAEVWPWLVQIGYQRAGWYSYDWIHRLMGIAGSVDDGSGQPSEHRSAERIIPSLQDLKVGDVVEIAPDMGYDVVEIESERALVLYVAVDTDSFRPFDPAEESPARSFESTWTWFLNETGPASTRLIVRLRVGYTPSVANALLTHSVMEPGSFVMERRTLLGIKRRAEAGVR